MPQHMVEPWQQGFVDRTRATSKSAAKGTGAVTTPANYDSQDALDAALTALSATTFSVARLNAMTLNDKVFALRSSSDSGTI